MKKTIKLIVAALATITAMSCTSAAAFADSIKSIDGVAYRYSDAGEQMGKYTGWAKNSNGKMYYKNGVKVTKNTIIKGIRYKFSADGYCTGKFTGWTKSTLGRRYWKNGVLLTSQWVKDNKGNYYYLGDEGYPAVGWVKVTRIGGTYSYFDNNGVWDGKVYDNLPDSDEETYTSSDVKQVDSMYSDYCVFDGGVYYVNVTDDSQWSRYTFTKGEYFDEIKYTTRERMLFLIKSGSANILPVGTKLYKTNENPTIILADLNGKLIPYLKIVEG